MIAIAKRKDVYRKYFEENIPETGNTKIGKGWYRKISCRMKYNRNKSTNVKNI